MNRFLKTSLLAFALLSLAACSEAQSTEEVLSLDEPIVRDKYKAEYGLKMSEDEEFYVNIRGYNFVEENKIPEEILAELAKEKKDAEDKIYAVDFVIEDGRKNPNPVSLDSSSTDGDRIDLYIIDKDDKRIDPVVSSRVEVTNKPGIYNVYYFIFKDDKDIKKIAVDSYIDGETILGSGVELAHEEVEEN